jgi:hypothetical protein
MPDSHQQLAGDGDDGLVAAQARFLELQPVV